ncbi:hypothetical protein [Metasolibacillus sp.]|uniref:hypothetical protein n=1 Tax=Metasolibacillus sp. TaxID=2703680 RepID=UPI0025ED3649|nr:hypothetical protein [Metasolibacillus sp.]MCT6922806.1 hypothetical protein [Metasolibacillus sp.]MCT6938855.1 hypothetical protein [Metasolibacillus sp.]
MPAFLKVSILIAIVFVFVTAVIYFGSTQRLTVRTITETDNIIENVNVGVLRAETTQDGTLQEEAYIVQEELRQNLIMEIASVQKNMPYDVKVDYVFTDAAGQATKEQTAIRGIYYRMQYVDKNGNIKGSAEKHLMLNELSN